MTTMRDYQDFPPNDPQLTHKLFCCFFDDFGDKL